MEKKIAKTFWEKENIVGKGEKAGYMFSAWSEANFLNYRYI